MPYKEKKIEKLYYSISEIADMFSVSQSLIRYWESEFEVLNPRKNGKDGDEPENLELGEIVKKLKEIKTFLTQLDELL